MRTCKKYIFWMFLAIVVLMFIACFSDWKGEGTIIINLSGNNSRTIMPWPPDDPQNNILDKIDYHIKIFGNDETIQLSANSKDIIIATVSAGHWYVTVEAFLEGLQTIISPNAERILYAAGSNSVDVKAGQNNPVSIQMTKAFDDIIDLTTPFEGAWVVLSSYDVEGNLHHVIIEFNENIFSIYQGMEAPNLIIQFYLGKGIIEYTDNQFTLTIMYGIFLNPLPISEYEIVNGNYLFIDNDHIDVDGILFPYEWMNCTWVRYSKEPQTASP